MTITKESLEFCRLNITPHIKCKKMLELGVQFFADDLIDRWGITDSEEYYVSLDYDLTRFSSTGDLHSLKVNIAKENNHYDNMFCVITDHDKIEKYKDQYTIFKNLHNWGLQDCVYLHILPLDDDEHKKHYNVPYIKHKFLYNYSSKFWEELCKECNYTVINITRLLNDKVNTMTSYYFSACVYVKTADSNFISKEKFTEIFNKYNKTQLLV